MNTDHGAAATTALLCWTPEGCEITYWTNAAEAAEADAALAPCEPQREQLHDIVTVREGRYRVLSLNEGR
ncbi:hypothetical protein [Mycobacterium asiaticum]|uniref:hypothetical protein n=1 Tax=Mycobacterium asiaticum TaxID=1790 RepID=UPI000568E989|nr:hypothetical protein [Mycobacterium asiaticum]ORA12614.1 hypothetical protein BST16_16855 [Mycobacterium asiaticum DSM 44297]